MRACVVEREYSVRQTLVFIAPPLPAFAQVVILAKALMGPHSTPSTVCAGQQHVILSMACFAPHFTANVHKWPSNSATKMVSQKMTMSVTAALQALA